jgi:hypothetical protein
MEQEELTAAKAHFPCITSRMAIAPDQLIIGRYSVLPFYRELEQDIQYIGARLINTYEQHLYVADLQNWVADLGALTPVTWSRLEDINGTTGPFVLKGATNSKKFQWKTHMFARDWLEAGTVYDRLCEDGLIAQQRIYIRQYVPLTTYFEDVVGLPVTKEFRFFVYNGEILTGGYYWSSHIDVLHEQGIDQAVMEGGEEDEVDEDVRKRFRELLNTLDGIDTKGAQVFVIFTTNKDPRRFDPTFTRESRLDSIINFTPPDEEAAERLLRWYLGDRLDPTTDLTAISAQLAGLRPASIKEVTAKATLGAARRLLATTDNLAGIINGNDLALAVGVSREQLELAKPLEKKEQPDSDEERAAVFLGKHIERAAELMSDRVSETVLRLARHQLGAEEKPALPDHQSNGHTTKALVEPTRTS